MDTVELADRLAATVIDYKLGHKTPDFNRMYYGLNLQLVTYLLVLSALGQEINGKLTSPAAALYVRLLRRIESVAHPDDAVEPPAEDFFLTSGNKARGVIDANFADDLDAVTEQGTSKAYALRKSQDAVELRRADVLEHGTFAALVDWTRQKIGALADQIIDGRIDVYPYRLKTLTPCSTCSYRPVCRLDLAFNRYHWIEPMGAKRLEQIVAEATP